MKDLVVLVHHFIAFSNIRETNPKNWTNVDRDDMIRTFVKKETLASGEGLLVIDRDSKGVLYQVSVDSNVSYKILQHGVMLIDGDVQAVTPRNVT